MTKSIRKAAEKELQLCQLFRIFARSYFLYWRRMNDLLDKLAVIHQKWLEIGEEITKPEVIADMKRFIKLSKDYKDLQAVVDAYKKYKNIVETTVVTSKVLDAKSLGKMREVVKKVFDCEDAILKNVVDPRNNDKRLGSWPGALEVGPRILG